MRVVKQYLLLSVTLGIYIVVISILLRSYYMYQTAYQTLSRRISHSSIEVVFESEEAKEE